uniref:Ig-like domain-containing protein n=1 Tax=Macrostomum lignano TaxID=282301 RepID=A0A1I8FNN3_9PLAT
RSNPALGDGGQLISAGRWFESSRLLCSTSGGNPAPSLTWQIRTNGGSGFESVEADSTKGAPVTPFGQVTSQLTLNQVRAEYNRAVVRCLATNPVANLSSPDYVLNVLYLPVVTAVPSLAIELGAEVAIECSATGNPEPTVRLENGAARFYPPSHTGPKVSGPGTVTARSGDQLTIQCCADANPAAPSSSVVWTHLSSGRSKSDVGATLVIRKVDRSRRGRLAMSVCQHADAELRGRRCSEMERPTRRRAVSQVSWTKSGSLFESAGTDPRLANVSLSDSGVPRANYVDQLGCGAGAPEWLEPQPRETKSASVTDSKDFRLVCTARAKPEPSFAWYKDGKLIPAEWFSVETSSVSEDAGLRDTPTVNRSIAQWKQKSPSQRAHRWTSPALFWPQPRPTITWQLALPTGETKRPQRYPIRRPSCGDFIRMRLCNVELVDGVSQAEVPCSTGVGLLTKDRATGQDQHETLRHLDFD